MEGVNLGAILLGFVAVLLFGFISLAAVVLLVLRQTRAARILFASGLFGASALGTLSFLAEAFHRSEYALLSVLIALSLLLAGVGQFVTALRSPGSYGAALGCVAGALAFAWAALQDTDYGEQILNQRNLGLAELGLLLAAASLVIAILRPRHNIDAFLWTAQAVLGGIAGFAVGDACIATRCIPLEPLGGQVTRVRFEVFVVGARVSEKVGLARIREGDRPAVRFIDEFPRPPQEEPGRSPGYAVAQPAWVYGTPAVGGVAGIIASLGIAMLLIRHSGSGPAP